MAAAARLALAVAKPAFSSANGPSVAMIDMSPPNIPAYAVYLTYQSYIFRMSIGRMTVVADLSRDAFRQRLAPGSRSRCLKLNG
jgi:hypothetical protein